MGAVVDEVLCFIGCQHSDSHTTIQASIAQCLSRQWHLVKTFEHAATFPTIAKKDVFSAREQAGAAGWQKPRRKSAATLTCTTDGGRTRARPRPFSRSTFRQRGLHMLPRAASHATTASMVIAESV